MEIPLFILALVAAFIYTLVASIRNSSRIKSLEREVLSLKRLMAAGVTSPVAAQAESAETTAKPDFAAETGSETAPGATAFQAEYASEPEEAAATEEVAREEAQPAPVATTVESPATKESFESLLGARWAVWAGGLALALGGIFLVKYSIESGLLSPAVRLSLAAIFGLVLGVAGEAVRRKAVPGIAATYSNAMIPGVLTAAGALTLFGVVYAAYGIYGYIGPGAASLPDLDVDVGPLGAGINVEPGVSFMSPAMDYAVPVSTWAPVYPQASLEVVPSDTMVEVSPSVSGADADR